jgi:Protein of unknown function (DUF1569)
MDSYLERLRQELEEAMARADASVIAHPPPGKWSASQIGEHLFLTYKQTNRGIAKCLEQGAPLATRGTLKDWAATLLVVKFGYLPNGRKAPERAMPQGMLQEDVRQGLGVELQKMSAGLDECEHRFGSRTRIMNHPFLGPLTAEEWRKFHWVHGRHHARQIRERVQFS